ncbi:MAG: hypothetical protein IT376_19740 [Polyangiaceae bacterium]|nr:hypothetical protein [Polyangiaceae bacterium]
MGPRRLTLVACATLACGAELRRPAYGPEPVGDLAVTVPEAPPPARVESVPPDPGAPCVWVDGAWSWDEGWSWTDGAWVEPPDGCHRSRPRLFWEADGAAWRLRHVPAGWHPTDPDARARCTEPRRCATTMAK